MKASSWGSFALILACLLPLPLPAGPAAASTTQVFVFGDDYSDNGNFFALTGQPPPPYWEGRATNGPVAVEWMLGLLDITLSDHAYRGARTVGNSYGPGFPGMDRQVADFVATVPPFDSSSAVFVLWGGARDLADAPNPTAVTAAITALSTQIQSLYNAGARRFVLANMLDISLSPAVRGLEPPVQAQLHALVVAFNSGLDGALVYDATLPGIKVARADMFSLFNAMVASPASYGFTNVTGPCLSGTAQCSNPSQYLFWDDINPTTSCHQVLGSELWLALMTTVPDMIFSDGFE